MAQTHSTKKYIRTVGSRKRAKAVVRLTQSKGDMTINGKPVAEYFTIFEFQKIVSDPLRKLGLEGKMSVAVTTQGGGKRGQAEAVRHALARALSTLSVDNRLLLKHEGYLTRDAREKERKKFGLKRARKAPQWGKR